MHTYTLQKNNNNSFSLQRDGHGCLCPKAMVLMPVVDSLGHQHLQPTQMGCSTLCPFASVVIRDKFTDQDGGGRQKDGTEEIYIIDCEGAHKELVLTATTEPEEKQPSRLIKM